MKCPACGVELHPAHKYCANCGAPVTPQPGYGPPHPGPESGDTALDHRLIGCLVVESGAAQGQVFQLAGTMRIGRAPENEIPLPDSGLSRQHAMVVQDPSGYCLTDLQSTNGTFVNERRIAAPHPLREGDRVRLGNTSLAFRWLPAVQPPPTSGVERTVLGPAAAAQAATWTPSPTRPTPRASAGRQASRLPGGMILLGAGSAIVVLVIAAVVAYMLLGKPSQSLPLFGAGATPTAVAAEPSVPVVTVVVTDTPQPGGAPAGPVMTVVVTDTPQPTAVPTVPAGPVSVRVAPDGSGQYPSLAEAVAAVPEGAIISLDAGTYRLAESLDVTKALSLVGSDMSATFVAGTGEAQVLHFTGPGLLTLKGITWRYEGTMPADVVTVDGGEIEVERCRFTGGRWDKEQSLGGSGLLLRGSSAGMVRESRFDENMLHGIEFQDGSQLTLESNVLVDNEGYGIAYLGQSGGIARQNECSGNGLHGIGVQGQAQPTLEANFCNRNAQVGIRYVDDAGGIARQNECSENGLHGIVASDNARPTLEGNTCLDNQQVGIYFAGASGGVAHQNECAGNKWGVYVRGSASPELTDNQCRDNTVANVVLWADDFTDPATGWRVGTQEGGEARYEDGELHIIDYTTPDTATMSRPGRYFTDLILEVESRLVGGALDNWHGFYCRYNDSDNHYVVAYSADGYYTGYAKVGGEQTDWGQESSEAIQQGVGATNKVRLACIGDSIRFWVNDQLLIDVTDSRLAGGDIALDAESQELDQTKIAYSKLFVFAP